MPPPNFRFCDFNGKVDSMLANNRAIILFKRSDREERALVKYDKVKFNGMNLPEDGKLEDYIQEGTKVSFSCHPFDDSGQDRCSWFVTQISLEEINKKLFPYLACNELTTSGLSNMTGSVVLLSNRQGVLSFNSPNGLSGEVFFLASKLYIGGTRMKLSLRGHQMIEEGTDLFFDAVPCHSEENEYGCQWFATVVWLGSKKPRVDYNISEKQLEELSFLNKIKAIAFNPRSMFVCGEGQIVAIIDAEYGIAYGSIRPNVWQSILFHRSMCFLFKLNLSTRDLQEVFKKGDKIKFIAVPAPKRYVTQLIATQISIFTDPRLDLHETDY